jgi:hypothetical protein
VAVTKGKKKAKESRLTRGGGRRPAPGGPGVCSGAPRPRDVVAAIGDRAAVAALGAPAATRHVSRLATVDVARPADVLPADDPDRAVRADGAGRVLLLQEHPPRAELVDLAASRVVASVELAVEGRDALARSWSDPKGSQGEGAVLLRGAHLLVAKEKHPKALVEFGPRGARSRGLARHGALAGGAPWPIRKGRHLYVALAVWWPDKALAKACADFSDLEVGPDGWLYLLSDKSASIARVDDLPPGGGAAALSAAWRLSGLEGKPEGLAFTPNGRAIVALDTRKARHNLVLLEPAIAAAG